MDKLSDYPMIEIFKFLPPADLKVASTVCKDWRRIIFSKQLMSKLTLKIDFSPKAIKKSSRSKMRHQRKFIKENGAFFTKAIITGRFTKKLLKDQFFKPLKNVKLLALINVTFLLVPNSDDCDLIKFPSLESLYISNYRSNPSQLNHVDPLSLKIRNSRSFNPIISGSNWLAERKNLFQLEIDDINLMKSVKNIQLD